MRREELARLQYEVAQRQAEQVERAQVAQRQYEYELIRPALEAARLVRELYLLVILPMLERARQAQYQFELMMQPILEQAWRIRREYMPLARPVWRKKKRSIFRTFVVVHI